MKQTLSGMVLLVLACSSANATLVSRSDGQAYYDTDTDLTWVADGNLAVTSGYCSLPDVKCTAGGFDWEGARQWIRSLNAQDGGLGYLGVNDWRLPTVTDTGTRGCNFAYAGTDCGYNVDLSTGEMARLFYGTLGNTGGYNTSGVQQPCYLTGPNLCLTNTGPFSNIRPQQVYFTGTDYYPRPQLAWNFSFGSGGQNQWDKRNISIAWAVRSGDIALIPVPPALWLFGSALGVMGVMRRKISS